MVDKVLIVLRKCNNIKKFEKECREIKLFFTGEKDGKFIYYTFEVRQLEKVKMLLLYYKLIPDNEEFYIKDRLKLIKHNETEKQELINQEFKRFGK